MNNEELRLKMENEGWTFEQQNWYDEEGIEGTLVIAPNDEEYPVWGWFNDIDADELKKIYTEWNENNQ